MVPFNESEQNNNNGVSELLHLHLVKTPARGVRHLSGWVPRIVKLKWLRVEWHARYVRLATRAGVFTCLLFDSCLQRFWSRSVVKDI
eukprot:SAG31_NODE_1766_length_7315_cov_2.439302_5_plen_87_part_00